jgi:hypothetical protein
MPARLHTTIMAASIVLSLAGCAGDGTPTAGTVTTYVGELAGTDALIAVAESVDQVVAYACDSKDIVWWFTGPVDNGGGFHLTGRSGAKLAGARSGDHLALTLTAPDGRTHTATATPATGDTGLYWLGKTVDGIHYSGAWVLKSATVQRGNAQGSPKQHPGPSTVIPGNPPSVTLDGDGFIDPASFAVARLDSDSLAALAAKAQAGP